MKYIKIFESESIEKITYDEFTKIGRTEFLNEFQILKIKNLLKSINTNYFLFGGTSLFLYYDILTHAKDKSVNFAVTDDYFYVNIRYKNKHDFYYKCDQLSSFLKLLKQKL